MSLDAALARIQQIQGLTAPAQPVAADTPGQTATVATAADAPTEPAASTAGAASFSQALGKADGIPVAAYRAAQPVQNGHLVQSLFAPRQQAAQSIASRFGLNVSSSYRTPEHNAEVGGVPNSFHTKGLAFDFSGSNSQMQAAKAWANRHPEMFQEVLVHDVGSGMHLHLAFRSS